MRASKNFRVYELVDKATYSKFRDSSIWFLDENTVKVLQVLRDRYGSCTVNNWNEGGNFQYRGFRPMNCTVGGKLSQHRMGRAFDCNFKNATPDEVREDIMRNEQYFLDLGMTTIEDGAFARTWLHFDTRWHKEGKIKIVKP